jgi:hypothetical protein
METLMHDDYSFEPSPVQPDGVGSAAATVQRSAKATAARIGLLGIAAAAILAAILVGLGIAASPTGTLAGSADSNTSPGTVDDLNGLKGGPGLRIGHVGGGITITAISGSSISLRTEDGWTRTITVDAGTTYTRGGGAITLADLAVGDEIGFRQTREDDGTWTIDAIAVILPHAAGEVTAVSGSTITIDQRDGTTATIKVDDTTTFTVNGDSAALADVTAGMQLLAEGTKNADGSLTATRIHAFDPDSFHGRDGRGPGRGFRFGPGFDWKGDDPNATAAPSATGSAS